MSISASGDSTFEGSTFTPENDDEFRAWLSDHPEGFVLSSDKAVYGIFHCASCRDLLSRSNWVRPGVVKVCSLSLDDLRAWAAQHPERLRVEARDCKKCSPSERAAGAASAGRIGRVWLFQGSPDTFDIDGYLGGRDLIRWTVRQEHLAPQMSSGDEVYIWRAIGTGGDRERSGVVASGSIVDGPQMMDEEPDARRFWKDQADIAPALRVTIRVTKVANRREVLKRDWMAEDPVLSGLGVLKLRNLTNYPVTSEQARRLRRLWENTGRDWSREESVAGLWAYDQTYREQISKRPGSVVANTAMLIGRAVGGVYNKVMNFRSLDPREERSGLSGAGDIDKSVWKEFFDGAGETLRSDALDDEFRHLWQSSEQADTGNEATRPVYAEFGEAPNDDPAELRTFLQKVRRGQPAFRRNLLAAYERKCCISGWGPEAVLEAAHIEEHAKTGLNSLANGLLLRSDLHALFDEGLLRIDPELLLVVLAPTLEGTPYWEFNGRPLRRTVRGESPSRELLLARWKKSRGS